MTGADQVLMIMIIILLIGSFLFLVKYVGEWYIWNKGICRITGKPWKLDSFDNDGSIQYVSEKGTVCIQYRFVLYVPKLGGRR